MFINSAPIEIGMYHERRKEKGKIKNYLVYNQRKKNGWLKKSKFIGYGEIPFQKLYLKEKEFELELSVSKKYTYLTKEQILELEKILQIYNEKINFLKKEELDTFQTSFFTELTYNSNSLEGNSLSLEETFLVLNENLAPAGKTLREIYEAKNHLQALQFLQEYSSELNERMILKLHQIILNNISEHFAGRYREGTVKIFGSEVKFPSAEKVSSEMANLLYWYNEHKKEIHPFELAVIFSTKFVSIHPFVDGNGRISRLLMNFILKRNNYPWLNVYTKQREEYLRAIRKGNDGDYNLILNFMFQTLKENLQRYGFL